MTDRTDPPLPETLAALLDGRELAPAAVEGALAAVLDGTWGDAEAAAFLVALRAKGETAEELAAAAACLRRRMVRLAVDGAGVLDTCGTGGDGSGTFNVSTAVALVVAGCGVRVVKHGNRAASSKSGSADVLAALGVPVESGPDWSRRCFESAGFAFCFAPHFHPVLARAAPLRRKLGVRTVFNLLGPLLNPAGADRQLIGVGRPEWLDPVAGALARLGTASAVVVCGRDGLDEVSLSAPTLVRRVAGGRVEPAEWTPADFGLPPCRADELRADGPAESAAAVRDVLHGRDGPALRVVLANAAAALAAAGHVPELRDGVAAARRAVESGAALRVLEGIRS